MSPIQGGGKRVIKGNAATPLREEMDITFDSSSQPSVVSQSREESKIYSDSFGYPEHSLTAHQRSWRPEHTTLSATSPLQLGQRSTRPSSSLSAVRHEAGIALPDDVARTILGYWLQLALK